MGVAVGSGVNVAVEVEMAGLVAAGREGVADGLVGAAAIAGMVGVALEMVGGAGSCVAASGRQLTVSNKIIASNNALVMIGF